MATCSPVTEDFCLVKGVFKPVPTDALIVTHSQSESMRGLPQPLVSVSSYLSDTTIHVGDCYGVPTRSAEKLLRHEHPVARHNLDVTALVRQYDDDTDSEEEQVDAKHVDINGVDTEEVGDTNNEGTESGDLNDTDTISYTMDETWELELLFALRAMRNEYYSLLKGAGRNISPVESMMASKHRIIVYVRETNAQRVAKRVEEIAHQFQKAATRRIPDHFDVFVAQGFCASPTDVKTQEDEEARPDNSESSAEEEEETWDVEVKCVTPQHVLPACVSLFISPDPLLLQ